MEDIAEGLEDVTMSAIQVLIQDNNIALYADIHLSDEVYSLKLSGEIFKSKQYSDSYTFKINDHSDDFEVMNMQLVRDIMPEELLIPENINSNEVFLLYILQKSTGKVILFEIPIKELPDDLFAGIDEEKIAEIPEISEEHWWLKYFEPSSSLMIQPRGGGIATRVVTTYHGIYRYEMTLKLNLEAINYPSNSIDATAPIYANLTVLRQAYYYDNTYQGDGNFLSVFNCYGKVSLDSGMDCIKTYSFKTVSTSAQGGFSGSLSLNIGVGPIGGSVTWRPHTTVTTIDGGENFANDLNIKMIEIPLIKPLTAANDKYSIDLIVKRNTGVGSVRNVKASFRFGVGYEGPTGPLQNFEMTATATHL